MAGNPRKHDDGKARPDLIPRSVGSRRRGTTNRNDRGNTLDRRRRREWLVDTFRADRDVGGDPACRCWRCGQLLTVDTVSPDRITPGCMGGRYTRDNIRPSCVSCQSITGGHLGNTRKQAKS